MYYEYNADSNTFFRTENYNDTILPQLVWHITDKCYLKCPYCFARKTGIGFNTDNIEEYIGIIQRLGVKKIDISGGEPLLFEELPALCDRIKSSGIDITLTTSSMGNETNRKWLIDNAKIFSRVMVSLDSYIEVKHNELRGDTNCFQNAVNLIESLSGSGFINYRINTVVTKHLLADGNILFMADFVNKLSPREWCIVQPHPINEKDQFQKFAISSEEYAKVVRDVSRVAVEKTKIEYRTNSNYSTYWILHPNGELYQNSDDYKNCYRFSTKNIEKIIKAIKTSDIWLPM